MPEPLPLMSRRVHFIRLGDANRQIKVLNVVWAVPEAQRNQGIWATLELTPKHVRLLVYDTAPDAANRKRLVCHPFPLEEPVLTPHSSPAKSASSHFRDWLGPLTPLFVLFA